VISVRPLVTKVEKEAGRALFQTASAQEPLREKVQRHYLKRLRVWVRGTQDESANSILAARKLAQYDGGRLVPAMVCAIADAVRWAVAILKEIDEYCR
jgi:hypothetical protein